MRISLNNLGLIFVGLALSAPAFADKPDPDPARFNAEIAAFTAWDSKNAFPAHAFLFVGSSSIRFWRTAEAFPGKPVINRGFGGSEISDVVYFYDRVIKPYAPAKIFFYAGDNDIAGNKSPQQVFEDYKELAARVRADFPDTELFFLSIKPSDARWKKWPTMAEANKLIREYTATDPKLRYVDVASILLGDDGLPKDVYILDGLHLNEDGYRLWDQVIAPLLVN
jgi:lysophospholipase L1-like esterase